MARRLKVTRGNGNIFFDVGFERAEAEVLLLRATLMNRFEEYVRSCRPPPQKCAARMGVSQTRLNDLLRGKIDKFRLVALVNMLGHAGMRVELKVRKAA